jgi:hypothetical protein
MASLVLNGRTYVLGDLSCTSLKSAFSDPAYPGYSAISCSADPIVNGSTITTRNIYASPPYVYLAASNVSVSSSTGGTTTDTFDYAYASGVWSIAFTSVVGLYLVAKNAGVILALIKGR